MANKELVTIIERFAESRWNLLDVPSKKWLSDGTADVAAKLLKAVEQAEKECGSCGCEFDPLYKRALELLRTN